MSGKRPAAPLHLVSPRCRLHEVWVAAEQVLRGQAVRFTGHTWQYEINQYENTLQHGSLCPLHEIVCMLGA